jgi:acyl transferase domain-containing protein/acyl carrier protein
MPETTAKQQKNRVDNDSSTTKCWSESIAIIGMSARFPQSQNVQEYWRHLLAGDMLISEFSELDIRNAGVNEQASSNSSYVRRGSIIGDADMLDAGLFNLSRREAEIIDPQQRILLECAWEALEDAGYTGEHEHVGVFAGVGMNTYLLELLANPAVIASAGGYQLMLANDKDFCATRIAYKLNLSGPAVNVQSACSTSLAAVHLACVSLLAQECDMALAGGASISFPQGTGYAYMPGMILSPDGFCRPFDAEAKGTVPGGGAGLVVLKRLSQAMADGDNIVAVIRGSAWNNDGAGKVGFTAPSVDGQATVLREALNAAGISPAQVGYVEAHGTATELGDPIEVAALTTVFTEAPFDAASCVLGAVKSNMGHADAAAGVGGLIKAALATNSGEVPPTPTYNRANPTLQLEKGPFFVSSSLQRWPKEGKRWAGVSSFGIGGTNVHVVLSEPPTGTEQHPPPAPSIFPLSARTPAALLSMRDRLATHLEANPALSAQAVASTLQEGRRELACRRAFVATDTTELIDILRKPEKAKVEPVLSLGRDVVYLFPGQGQQFFGMAPQLYESDATFRQVVEEGAALLRDEFGIECIDLICGAETPIRTRLYETDIAQPLLFLVEYALAMRWLSLGVEPSALVGHSLGELTAATVAGVFSFADGLRLAAERGQLMAQTPAGIMLAAVLPPERLSEFLEHDIWIASENGPKMTVASGPVSAVEALEKRLKEANIASVRLASKNAFHTPLMSDAAKAFRLKVESVIRRPPQIPLLSNVTGGWIDPVEVQSGQYWGSQILSRVRFTQNLAVLADRPRLLLEVGPGEALIGIAKQQLPKSVMVASLGTEKRRSSDDVTFLGAVARAWESGATVKWHMLRPDVKAKRVPLPTYPFERERFHVDSAGPLARQGAVAESPALKASSDKPVKRDDIADWFYTISWSSTPSALLSTRDRRPEVGVWLVLLDDQGLGSAVVERLSKDTAKCITVSVAGAFRQEENKLFIDPANPDHYRMLWQAIDQSGLHPEGLLNFWAIHNTSVETYDSMVLLLQAARLERQRFRYIEVITDSLESVNGEPISDPIRSQVLGLLRMLPAEYSGIDCRSTDVHLASTGLDQTASQIAEELQIAGKAMSVAYRRGLRWQRTLIESPLPASTNNPFREKGVYLITGGTGGIGYSIALHLLQNYNASVILTGRGKLPPQDEWDTWGAQHGQAEETTRRILRMKELAKSGGKIIYLDADVTNVEEMTRVIGSAETQYGAINGVIHAAGVAGSGTIATETVAESRKTKMAKVSGSLTLVKALNGRQLDFLLLCSSISAWMPALAQSAYAAANTFQDYFAMYCRSTLNIPAVAIGFDAWQEVGMAADMVLPVGLESVKEERLRTAMTTAEGIEVVRRVLSLWRAPHILTSTVELNPLLAASPENTAPAQQTTASVPVEGDNPQLHAILEIWKDLLAVDAIEPTDNFFELGGHSLMGTMMIARLRDQFGVTLTLRTLFDAPTPLLLAECLRSQQVPPANLTATDDREEFAF